MLENGVILFHQDFALYDHLDFSSEGGRIELIVKQLILNGFWGEQIVVPKMAPLKRIKDVHDEKYLNSLAKLCNQKFANFASQRPIIEKSFELARIAVGGVLTAIDLIMANKTDCALCLTAMPGHNAGIGSTCNGSLINYAAIGANFLRKKYDISRIVILDLDAAHGSGTQEIFLKQKDVLCISIHEYPGILGTGHYSEFGESQAIGYNLNVPFPSGYGDRELIGAFNEIIRPVLIQFKPEFFILSFGTNILREDPSSHLLVSEFGILHLLSEIRNLAKPINGGKIISILESGIPSECMARVIFQHASLLLNNRRLPVDKGKKDDLISYSDWYSYSNVLKGHFRKFWKL